MSIKPTAEQQHAIELARHGNLTMRALAGTGKTTSLKMIASDKAKQAGLYVSFSKAIVEDAKSDFPQSVTCATSHSLAYRAVGHKYRNRLNGERQLYREVSNILGIYGDLTAEIEGTDVVLSTGEQVHAIKGAVDRFCTSGDESIQPYHIPVPDLLQPWRKQYREAFAPVLMPKIKLYWEDICSKSGKIKFSHNNYLKIWQLQKPKLNCDYLMYDEAQDANGVTLAIVLDQDCQKIFVGDANQQIYSWNGSVNAMDKIGSDQECWLTESWRFGQGIADVANQMLANLGCKEKLIGRGPESRVASLEGEVDTILFRTNGACVSAMFAAHEARMSFHLVGGVDGIRTFVSAAGRMITNQRPNHPDLNCFETWGDVINFASSPEADSDTVRLVRLINKNGVSRILEILNSAEPSAYSADLTISTAHKSKGLQWPRVAIGGDFSDTPTEEEKRLLYVASTRAQRELDHTAVHSLFASRS